MEAYRQRARRFLLRGFQAPLVRLLVRVGITPHQLTILGLLLNLGVAFLVFQGWFLAAGALLVVASTTDLFDGAVARATGKTSARGALLDSLADRLSETVVLLGLLGYYIMNQPDDWLPPVLVYLALTNGILVSYVRSRSEGLGVISTVGLMTRPERVIVLAGGLLVGWTEVALGIIAALSLVTWVHRFIEAWRSLGQR